MPTISPMFAIEAEQYLLAGLTDEALNLCLKGISVFPDYPAAYTILTKVYLERKNYLKADEIATEGIAKYPTNKILINIKSTNIDPYLNVKTFKPEEEYVSVSDISFENFDTIKEALPESENLYDNHKSNYDTELTYLSVQSVKPDFEVRNIFENDVISPELNHIENANTENDEDIEIEDVKTEQGELNLENLEFGEIQKNIADENNELNDDVSHLVENSINQENISGMLITTEEDVFSDNSLKSDKSDSNENFINLETDIEQNISNIEIVESEESVFKRLLLKSDKFDNVKYLRAGNLSLIPGLEYSALKVYSSKPKAREHYSELIDPPPFYEIKLPDSIASEENLTHNLKSVADLLKSVSKSNDNTISHQLTESEDDFHVTETMAKILISQKAYEQAYEIYLKLAKSDPDKADIYIGKAEELKSKF